MWIKYQTSIAVSITFLVLFSMFWFVQPLAMVLFLSVLLTILLSPAVNRLTAKKVPRALAAGITLLTFIAVVITVLVMLSKTFLPTLANFIADLPHMAESLNALPILQQASPITAQFESLFKDFAAISMTALKSSLDIIINVFHRFLDLIITLFITFYLLTDGAQIKQYLSGMFADQARVLQLFNRILNALSSYIRGQLMICFITGCLVFVYFTLRDIPYASVFAALSAVGEFIPVVGPTVASAFGSLLSFTQSPLIGLQTLLFYAILTQVNHNVVYPYLIGKSLNLHPIAIMIGILFGGELLGALGMFLAVPCMVTIKLIIEDICRHRPAAQ